MTSKRGPNESFEAYKKRQKRDTKEAKERARGKVIWNSSNIIPKPGGTVGELVKVRNQGTYRKPKKEYHHRLSQAQKIKKGEQENAET